MSIQVDQLVTLGGSYFVVTHYEACPSSLCTSYVNGRCNGTMFMLVPINKMNRKDNIRPSVKLCYPERSLMKRVDLRVYAPARIPNR